jgi:hypothetical protein
VPPRRPYFKEAFMRVHESESNFTAAPQGLHQAVCHEIRDMGVVETPWGKKPMVLIGWQLAEIDPETNRRFFVFKRYNATLGKKAKPSNLREDLESWRGKAFTEQEAADFDLDALKGVNCQLSVVHNLKDGTTYANVKTVVQAAKGEPKLTIVEYEKANGNGNGKPAPSQPAPRQVERLAPPPPPAAVDPDDDDCPF